jgi:hypothetical protein
MSEFVFAFVFLQPQVKRSRNDLSDREKPIYDALMDLEYVKKFVSFLALEENKGKDKFRHKNMTCAQHYVINLSVT